MPDRLGGSTTGMRRRHGCVARATKHTKTHVNPMGSYHEQISHLRPVPWHVSALPLNCSRPRGKQPWSRGLPFSQRSVRLAPRLPQTSGTVPPSWLLLTDISVTAFQSAHAPGRVPVNWLWSSHRISIDARSANSAGRGPESLFVLQREHEQWAVSVTAWVYGWMSSSRVSPHARGRIA